MSDDQDRPDVVVVTGAGGMGSAIARRIGSGRRLVLADVHAGSLQETVGRLRAEGHRVTGVATDVSDRASVEALAATAASRGRLVAMVHTAGVSAATGTAAAVLAVDLLGTAHVIDAFGKVAPRGFSLVCVSSMAGHYATLSAEDEHALATFPTHQLLSLPVVQKAGDSGIGAYILAKRANHVRVQAAARAWSRRGTRINTVSPGVISTPMAKAEQESASGASMMAMLEACGIGRTGTPAEVAEVAAFLTGPGSLYITGTDILVDGGQAAWIRWHRPR
jgi:NAD(P)-dependent dehydrogenase (short-subunit alcohol dehydrogenase family)